MSATTLYRIAAVVLVLFAAGHTFGFTNLRPPTAEGLAVRDAMRSVQFEIKGSTHTYGKFYTGFGLTITVYLLFSAVLAWHLGNLAQSQPQAIGMLGWAFVALQLVSAVLSVVYFFAMPAILSVVVAICLGWATWLVQR